MKVNPVVIGALGTVSKDLHDEQLDCALNFSTLQNARLLGTLRILLDT